MDTIKNSRIVLFGKLLALYISILVFLTVGVYYLVRNKVESDIRQEEQRDAFLLSNKANDIVNQLRTDILFLASEVELFYNTEEAHFMTLTASLFQKYASVIHVYDQIRYIDNSGEEIVRMNLQNDSACIVPDSQLQNKGNRYYFNETMQMEGREIYVSPIDLNMDNGQVQVPYKPIIRIGINLYDRNSEKIGILITNFKAVSLINIINKSNTRNSSNKYLLNKDGYYLIGPDSTQEWGFMFGKSDAMFQKQFIQESEIISNHENGIFTSSNGLFVFSTIHFVPTLTEQNKYLHSWKLISHISSDKVFNRTMRYFKRGFIYALGISMVIILLLWILSRNIYQRQKAQQALENSNKALEEIVRTKDKFFSIISHDLRSPFTGIIGYSHMLKSDLDSYTKEEVIQFISSINKSAENTYKMLDNLLQWARVQSGTMAPVPEDFELKEVLDMIQASFETTLVKKQIVFDYNCDKAIVVFADKMMVKTVVHNLISNAIKFTQKGGAVSIDVKSVNDTISIMVTDTGIGMDKQAIAKLFKVDSIVSTKGTDNETGTGLGLVLTKEFVELNHGKIKVDSQLGKGTRFKIILPVKHWH